MCRLRETQKPKSLLYSDTTRKIIFYRIDNLIVCDTSLYYIIAFPWLLPFPACHDKVKPLLIISV